MKAVGVIVVASLAAAAHATNLPQVERPPALTGPAHSDSAQAVPVPEEPKFTQVSTEEYNEYKHGMTALHKILKPENMKTLKKLTAMLNQQNTMPAATNPLAAMSAEKLTALLASAMATQPEGFDFNSMNRVLENWKQQISRGPFANIVPALPADAAQFVQPTVPLATVAGAPVMSGQPIVSPALTNFAQVAPIQYALPPIPYFQITPQAGYQFAQAQPAMEEFTSPQQLLSVQM